MAKRFKNVAELITSLSEDENFKKDAVKHISENGLGKFLAFLRCKHRLTQKELADKIGCTQGRISKIESAKDDSLSIRDFIDYGNALDLKLQIGYRSKKMTLVEMVKYHAFQMQKYLNRLVEVAKEDKAIEAGVLDFHIETLKNVPSMILSSMTKLPDSLLNKVIKASQTKVHISSPIEPKLEVDTKKETVST